MSKATIPVYQEDEFYIDRRGRYYHGGQKYIGYCIINIEKEKMTLQITKHDE